jgi:hypothetical protein
MHWLEKLKIYFLQANEETKADEIDVKLEKLGPRLIEEMKVIRSENTFSKDAIDNITEEILKLPIENVYKILPTIFILDTEAIMEQKQERDIHILDFLTKSIYSKLGRKVATIGNSDEDERGHLIQEQQLKMSFSSILLHFILTVGKEKNILSVESFIQFAGTSSVIAPNRYRILERAFKAWLAGDYVVAIHLIIPQIESACLIIAKNGGKAIYKENKYGGYNVRLFGDLLRDDVMVHTLGTDGTDYFMTLFTDPRGFNLRNEVAHGLRDTEGFDENMANSTLIALFHLINCTS